MVLVSFFIPLGRNRVQSRTFRGVEHIVNREESDLACHQPRVTRYLFASESDVKSMLYCSWLFEYTSDALVARTCTQLAWGYVDCWEWGFFLWVFLSRQQGFKLHTPILVHTYLLWCMRWLVRLGFHVLKENVFLIFNVSRSSLATFFD